MTDRPMPTRPYVQPAFWLTIVAYVVLSVGMAVYIDGFTPGGQWSTWRDFGISTAACYPFLLLEFAALLGGSALLVRHRLRSVGLGLLTGAPIAFAGIMAYVTYFG